MAAPRVSNITLLQRENAPEWVYKVSSTSENIMRLFVNWDEVSKSRDPFALRKILVFLYLQENGLAERAMVEEMWGSVKLGAYPTVEKAAENRREFFEYNDSLKEKKMAVG